MWEWLEATFGPGFMPHGHCYLWSPSMVWTQVVSNLLIGLAYASIAATLVVLVRKIRNIPFAWVYVAFGVFILSCGLTHWIDIVTVWHPIYWFDAAVRVVTALASVFTAVTILPMVPRAVALAHSARVSEMRREELEETHEALATANAKLAESEERARARADKSEAQFRSLVETMPQLAWLSAPDGKNLYRNRRWSEYTGLALDVLAEGGWEAVHDPELVAGVVEKWRRSLSSGEPFETECRIRRADGELRWFLARALPLRDAAGEITAWMGTCTDIHEQRALREEALHVARLKDEFIATVSHELRTPLNAILGWSKMLRGGLVRDDVKTRALETIERNALAQVRLIDDLLDVSRIVSGKMRLQVTPVATHEPVEAAIESVALAAHSKSITVKTEIDRTLSPIMADPARLQQVVWNLLSNAVKFTEPGGRIDVALAREGGDVVLTVTDDGAGIPPDFIPHVFERFSQQDGSVTRRHGGLGLGLALVRQLVELHGGSVGAASDGPKKGTRFTVKLPLERTPALTTSPSPSSSSSSSSSSVSPAAATGPAVLAGLRVLVVEDAPDSRELIAAVLEEAGAHVTTVATAADALAALETHPIDAVISDLGLPDMDGLELARAIRADPRRALMPMAALTAMGTGDDRRRALTAGFGMHVVKPIDPNALVDVALALKAGARHDG